MFHLYPVQCHTEQSEFGVKSSVTLSSFVGVLLWKGAGACVFTFPLLPLRWAWLGPALMQSRLRAARRCLQFLRVSVALVHLERRMTGEFPLLPSWRNLPADVKLLCKINFFSCDWFFFWFDSVTSKLLSVHVHELNCASPHTIS